ncbi:hypothetical protein [Marinobacter sp. CA1]|uniref:hypothetical protein n=1 Tax=Marinobacter sp. CA1 TaxID=2817656 RepID=UPI001D077A38|nr:hypothetical protein [Marinobacter sp. CA1]UDL03984.1 hypothetical protein J2887_14845 [Marinobacter sp. CA1]
MKKDQNQVKVRFQPECKKWIERQSRDQERSQTWIINDLVRKAIQNEGQVS